MKELVRYKKYSRKDIHDIFSPNTIFTSGAGTWGLQGIIKVPDTTKDYIFLVTYGSTQGSHEFDENIDLNGVLTWQSQPSQGFDDTRIKDFINHDYLTNNIYLFLRKSARENYSYMGKLAYIEHDNQREKPVYFKWQILDWNCIEENKIKNKSIIPSDDNSVDDIDIDNFKLILHEGFSLSQSLERRGKSTKEFNNKNYNFEGEAQKNTKLGNAGEDVIVNYEKKYLINIGREDLAEQVMTTRSFAGNAERFDVLSFDSNGNKKYIEVKTTTGGFNNTFHISENEVLFSEQFSDNYYLYRIYNFNSKTMKGDLIIIKGSIDRKELSSTNYICRIGEIKN